MNAQLVRPPRRRPRRPGRDPHGLAGRVADLDPTDRRFRVYNQAAEVLLDPRGGRRTTPSWRRRASAAELREAEVRGAGRRPSTGRGRRPPPDRGPTRPAAGSRAGLAAGRARLAASPSAPGVRLVITPPSDAAVARGHPRGPAAAERAIVPILSYDAKHLDAGPAGRASRT